MVKHPVFEEVLNDYEMAENFQALAEGEEVLWWLTDNQGKVFDDFKRQHVSIQRKSE